MLWDEGQDPPNADLVTGVSRTIGQSLGLDYGDNRYDGPKPYISADHIARIQALYGKPSIKLPTNQAVRLQFKHSKLCMTVEGSGTDGDNVAQDTCSESASTQQFRFIEKDGWYQVRSENGWPHDQCVDIFDSNIYQSRCNNGPHQQFRLYPNANGDGWYSMRSRHNNQCVTAKNTSTNIVQWPCQGHNSQLIRLMMPSINAVSTYKEGTNIRIGLNVWETTATNVTSQLMVIIDGVSHKVCTDQIPSPSSHPKEITKWCSVTGALGPLAVGAYVVYGRTCAADTQCMITPGFSFEVIADPKASLNLKHWNQRKLDGMGDRNRPYTNTSGKHISTYYTNWSVYARKFVLKDIPVENLTHIYHAFLGICHENATWRDGSASTGGYNAFQQRCKNRLYEVAMTDADTDINGPTIAPWINDAIAFDSSVVKTDPVKGIFGEYYRMKKVFPHIKILPSIGGYSLSDPFSRMAASPEKRAIFIKSAINFIQRYDFFDGLDLDWEFPGGGGPNPDLASPEDGANFAILVKELRAALDDLETINNRKYVLHAAVGVSGRDNTGGAYIGSINWEQAQEHLDHINVMSYDYLGAWNTNIGHHTALKASYLSPAGLNVEDSIQVLLDRQVPSEKISVGVAMYARGWDLTTFNEPKRTNYGIAKNESQGIWEAGIQDYKGVEKFRLSQLTKTHWGLDRYSDGCNDDGASGTSCLRFTWDLNAEAPMLEALTTRLTFDSAFSIKAKGAFVRSKNLGGLFSWSIDGDSGTLLNAMHKGLRHASASHCNNPDVGQFIWNEVLDIPPSYDGSSCFVFSGAYSV